MNGSWGPEQGRHVWAVTPSLPSNTRPTGGAERSHGGEKRSASCLQRTTTSWLRQFNINREHALSYQLEATETVVERPSGVAEQQVENRGMRQAQPPAVPAGVTQWWRLSGTRTPAATSLSRVCESEVVRALWLERDWVRVSARVLHSAAGHLVDELLSFQRLNSTFLRLNHSGGPISYNPVAEISRRPAKFSWNGTDCERPRPIFVSKFE